MHEILKVDRANAERIEYLGTKRKFWFSTGGTRYLFKAEERGTGEDWAEKIVCELADLLGIPHVNYELAAEYEGERFIQPGVVCPTMLFDEYELIHGNQMLGWINPGYPAEEKRRYKIRDYTVTTALEALQIMSPPPPIWCHKTPIEIEWATSYFCGYLMLDAWVANQDRHHQNWGVLFKNEESGGDFCLAPTFDHGSSLARNISDEERKERLETKDIGRKVETFAKRARSGFYKTPKENKTLFALDAFREIATIDPDAAEIWLNKLSEVSPGEVEHILDRVPPKRMTPVTKRFTLELLKFNQTRLLESLD